MTSSLDDAEQSLPTVQCKSVSLVLPSSLRVKTFTLLSLLKTLFRATSPTHRQVQTPSRCVVSRIARRAFIKRHHDLGIESCLDIHRDLRRQKALAAVDVRTKFHAVLGQFSHLSE